MKPFAKRLILFTVLLSLTCVSSLLADDYTYTTNPDDTITITGYTGPGGALNIPDTVNGLPVTGIGDKAFYKNPSPTSIMIPNTVTSIGVYAFSSCSNLTSVTIGTGVVSIGDRAFQACNQLMSVAIPNGVSSIGSYAFSSCAKLATATVGNNIRTVGDYLFWRCTNLTSVTISDRILNSVTQIGNFQFWQCTSLTNIIIGSSTTSIGAQAFNECSKLLTVTIPGSVTNIGNLAFASCTNLTSVVIGNGATSIGSQAFTWCNSLTNVIIGNCVTSIGAQAFYSCSSLANVTIPDSIRNIGSVAFGACSSLSSVYFLGNAPGDGVDSDVFSGSENVTVYRLSGASGWPPVPDQWAGRTTALWNPMPSKIIGVGGNLSFGNVITGTTATATMVITNSGDATLTVTDITYPSSFSGAWSGTIAAGNSTNVTVTFAPTSVTNYSGIVTVNSDKTSGINTITASGAGIAISAQTNKYLFAGSKTNVTLNPGTYIITAYGAQGGDVYGCWGGGLGAEMKARFYFPTSTTLTLLVGGSGATSYTGGGGGGGSFVVSGSTPLIIAGGGGGSVAIANPVVGGGSNGSTGTDGVDGGTIPDLGSLHAAGGSGGYNGAGGDASPGGYGLAGGAGGGGFYSAGGNGGSGNTGGCSFLDGGAGGIGYSIPGQGGGGSNGGYGGGGGGINFGGGGGGGYSGGGGGGGPGGGGGSYIHSSAVRNLAAISGVASPDGSPNGEIIIEMIPVSTEYSQLTVNNGTGSGSYTNGAVVAISASNAPSGQIFDRWTGATQYVANALAPSTTVTMPAQNITLTATYKSIGVADFSDGFEGPTLNPYWVPSLQNGTIGLSAAMAHGGAQSVLFHAPGGQGQIYLHLRHYFDSPQYGTVTIWVYDSREYIYFNMNLENSLTGTSTVSIGVQDWDNSHFYYNASMTASIGGQSSVSRTIGWRKVTFQCLPTELVMKIDDQELYRGSGTLPFDVIRLTVSGPSYNSGNICFDDFSFVGCGVPNPDSDTDGIPDSWEQQYFGGTTNANPNALCANRVNTVREAYIAGLNPNDQQSRFMISNFRPLSDGNAFDWTTVPGRIYSIYWTTNLLNGFQPLETNIPWTRHSFTNSTIVPQGFFKIKVQMAE